jgi:two-component system sensor histidine kinase BarA
MELGHLPVIDWDEATRLAGNNTNFAEEIITLLLKGIASDIQAIKKAFHSQDAEQFLFKVHKLHGAVCYCGMPRLKTILARLESDLKNNIMGSSAEYLAQLDSEVKLLLERYSHLILKDRKGIKLK